MQEVDKLNATIYENNAVLESREKDSKSNLLENKAVSANNIKITNLINSCMTKL